MPLEIEKTNEIEKPAEAQPAPGEVVEVTNPIEPVVVYSDVPGAGPDDVPDEDEAEEPKPKAKAVSGPPNTKARSKARSK